MLCEKCQKEEASVFYEETVNGVSRSLSLCPACAKKLQKSGGFPSYMNADEFFSAPQMNILQDGLFATLFGLPEKPTAEKTCPLCRSTLRHIAKNGKAGCPECYRTFSAELASTVRSIHSNVKHIGRAPAKYKKRQEETDHLSGLRARLQEAIAEESFELAAKLRDEIRALEAKGKEE